MKKRFWAAAVLSLSLCLMSMVHVVSAGDWNSDKDMIVTLFQTTMGDSYDGIDHDLSVYKGESIRFKVDFNASKDSLLGLSNSEIMDSWSNMTDSLVSLSESGHGLLDSLGHGDRCFIVCIVDDVDDETSDVWYVSVNGYTVYDAFGK